MKKNEKIVIGVLVVITVILIIVAIVKSNKDESAEVSDSSSASTQSEEEEILEEEILELEEDIEDVEEYVIIADDGTKINTSEKLSETKTIDGIEITNIQLTESGNVTQLLATMTNTSDETQGGYIATLTLIDEDGNAILEMSPYIDSLEPGESTELNASATLDYANAYDFTIEKRSE